jgi:peroxiredoxin
MKHILFILIATVSLYSCNRSADTGYSISGTIENAEGMMLYLEDISTPQIVIIDTSKVEKNEFELKGNAEEGLYRLRLIPTNENVVFYLPGEKSKIEITMDKQTPYEYTISGNEPSIAIKKLTDDLVLQTRQYNELKNLFALKPDTSANVEDELGKSMNVITNTLKKFVSDNNNGFLKTYALTMLPNPNEDLEYIYNELKAVVEENSKNGFAKSVFEEVEKFKNQREMESSMGLAIGKEAPDIVLPDVNGKTKKLSSLRGKVVLIDFWAAWCKPCRVENPNVVRVHQKYKERGFEVFSVSLDKDKNSWTSAIREDGLYWENHVSDLKFWNSEVVSLYNIKGIPLAILIDAEGKIIAKNLRGQALDNRLAEIFN